MIIIIVIITISKLRIINVKEFNKSWNICVEKPHLQVAAFSLDSLVVSFIQSVIYFDKLNIWHLIGLNPYRFQEQESRKPRN